MDNKTFQEMINEKSASLYRHMPWRDDARPYYVLVSELMLQQTQVGRVIPKFEAFIEKFPDEKSLASATLADVLKLWQGLGYNRRAKFLHETAKTVISEFNGNIPEDERELLQLPGVGTNTAGAIRAYAFNQPAIFVETNIRTVYIHHFFDDQFDIDDKQIIKKLEETIDREHPREFYWALMDYGSWLKSQGVRNISSSRHYKKQPPLLGSDREMRGIIVRELSHADHSPDQLAEKLNTDDRYMRSLRSLQDDGLIQISTDRIYLTK